MKVLYQVHVINTPGYGDRIWVDRTAVDENLRVTLNAISKWGGPDKTDGSMISWEFGDKANLLAGIKALNCATHPSAAEPEFRVVFFRTMADLKNGSFGIIGSTNSLEEAKALRVVSGDVVIDKDNNVVKDPAWLWDWERDEPSSYAHRLINEKGW